MTAQEVKRKLAAILSADVKGYSRLMGEDEVGTIQTLTAYKEVMAGLIQHHRGRVVDAPGDNVLAEFGSVVDAVQSAVEIQKELKARNAELPENRRMEFRIGVNLGDVVEDGEQILGDGVNIAARLESLSEAGGISISGTAYDHVENKLSLGYQYFGEQTVKNIAKPVRVYRVLMEPGAAGKIIGTKQVRPRRWKSTVIGLVAAVIVIVAAVVIWKLYTPSTPQPEVLPKEKMVASQPEKAPTFVPPSVEAVSKEKVTPTPPEKVSKPVAPPPPKEEVASKEKMAFRLPDLPSIAVLPFVNMSEDPKQEFLSDGITEEITTALSKIPRIFVISRQSAFSYKGKPVKVKQVSEELGVRYVLEGSVQRSADRIRINAQLIDALTGRHLWAERYDRDLKDLFALQDEITMKILVAIQVKLTEGEQLLGKKPRLECYLKMYEGFKYYEGFNIEANRMAQRTAEEMIATCPEYSLTYVLMGFVHLMEVFLRTGKSPQESVEKGIEMAQKAIAIDDSSSIGHSLLCSLYSVSKQYDKAIAEGERAVALNPNGAFPHEWYAASLSYAGRAEEAIPIFQKAIRLHPVGNPGLFVNYAMTLRMTGRFEEAVSAYRKALQRSPDNFSAHLGLAATYSMMGREKEARAEAEEVLRLNPKFSVEGYTKVIPHKNQAETDRIVEALRKAGLK